jgi:hypothetical protein
MKLRFLAMGGIVTVLSAGLIASRGIETALVGFLVVGIALLVLGALWK